MTQGAEWKHLLLFALPIMAGNALQQLYNTVDGIIVGNFVGDIALGAVGACSPLTMVFIALAIGMSNGSAVVVGQYYGAGKPEEMRRTVSTSVILLLVLGAVLSLVGVTVARPMLSHVMKVSAPYLDYAVDYFTIYALGLLFQFAYNIFASVLRALGDSKATLYFLLISSVVNTVLDLIFVLCFHWDVKGAALATVISQAAAAIAAFVYMHRRYEILRFRKGEFRFHKASAALTMKIAIPSTMTHAVVSCGSLAIQRIINDFGAVYAGLMSGATAGMRLESFVLIPIFSFNAAGAAFSSQNVGAGKMDRVKRGRNAGLIMGLICCTVISLTAFLLRAPLVSLFGVSPEGLTYGVKYLTVLCPSLLLFCLMMTTSGIMHGAGDAKFGAFMTLSSFVVRILFAYICAYTTPMEYLAVWLSIPVGWTYNLILCWARYYSGAWKKKGIAHIKT